METHEIISRKTLCGCFSLLRQSLTNWQAGNLYFLNSHALYQHLSALPCGKDTIGGILTQMESCIPMALTTDSLEKFLLGKKIPRKRKIFWKAPKRIFSFCCWRQAKTMYFGSISWMYAKTCGRNQMDKPKERRFCYGRKTLS